MLHRSTRLPLLAALLAACASPSMNDVEPDPGAPRDMRVVDLRPVATPCGVCAGRTPVCDQKTRTCVACLVDADCGGGARCVNNACLPSCSAQKPCGDAGICNLDAGVCGAGCTADAQCKDPNAPVCDRATGRCFPCTLANDRCAGGSYCQVQGGVPACVPGCKGDPDCAAMDPAFRCCAHKCLDASGDAANCGSCGNVCARGASCCGGACLNTANDPANCGGCGRVCNLSNASFTCSAGNCAIVRCDSGYGDCDGNPQNGCEADLESSKKNCGACGRSCLIACLLGSCFPA